MKERSDINQIDKTSLSFAIGEEVHTITVEEFISWLKSTINLNRSTKGYISSQITTLRAYVKFLSPKNPISVNELIEKTPLLSQMHQKELSFSESTRKTYMTALKRALYDYQNYLADPNAFKHMLKKRLYHKSINGNLPQRKPKELTKATKNQKEIAIPPLMRSFPLPDGRNIEFSLPENLTQKEAIRFSYHILTYIEDFEPNDPFQKTKWREITDRGCL